jgi:hypothetical protein
MKRIFTRTLLCLCCAAAVSLPQTGAAQSQLSSSDLSVITASVLVASPLLLGAGAGSLAVKSIAASGNGVVWVLERASDGAQMSLQISERAASAAAVTVGSVLTTTAISTGTVLLAGSAVVAFIPSEAARGLLYNERVTR